MSVPGAVEPARVDQLETRAPRSSLVVVMVGVEVLSKTSWAVTKVMRANKATARTLKQAIAIDRQLVVLADGCERYWWLRAL